MKTPYLTTESNDDSNEELDASHKKGIRITVPPRFGCQELENYEVSNRSQHYTEHHTQYRSCLNIPTSVSPESPLLSTKIGP